MSEFTPLLFVEPSVDIFQPLILTKLSFVLPNKGIYK